MANGKKREVNEDTVLTECPDEMDRVEDQMQRRVAADFQFDQGVSPNV